MQFSHCDLPHGTSICLCLNHLGLGSESASHEPSCASTSSSVKRAKQTSKQTKKKKTLKKKGPGGQERFPLFPRWIVIPILWLPGILSQYTPLMSTRGQQQGPGQADDYCLLSPLPFLVSGAASQSSFRTGLEGWGRESKDQPSAA